MAWKECHVMDERLQFVGRLIKSEKVAPLCAEFGISRKTGFTSEKWSGRLDSNQRPPAPKAGALPGCATPRLRWILCDIRASSTWSLAASRASGSTPRSPDGSPPVLHPTLRAQASHRRGRASFAD